MGCEITGPNPEALFRKAALDRLKSPEQLDEAIQITSPGSWIALIATGALTLALLIWSLVGSLPTQVEGQGILIASGGRVTDAVTTAPGTLVDRGVRAGAFVRQGEPLASLAQPGLSEEVAASREQVAQLDAAIARQGGEESRLAELRVQNAKAQVEAQALAIAAAQQRVKTYGEMLASEGKMAAQGLSTDSQVQAVRERLSAAQQEVVAARSRILEINAEVLSSAAADARLRTDANQQALKARQSSQALASSLARSTIVAAPASGRLIEWKASFGSYVGPGATVASVLSGARTLQFVLYIPPSDGKRVKVGMSALIELDGVHKEDWGSLVGRVSSVSEFPSTPEGMRAVLQNDALVKSFSGQGAPFLARVDLIPDPRSPTGYKWSGGRGPPGALGSGATGTGRVVVQEQHPIAYVLGFLRKASGA